MNKQDEQQNAEPQVDLELTALDHFLRLAEEKTTDPIHRRLLLACRNSDPAKGLETELQAIVLELLHAD